MPQPRVKLVPYRAGSRSAVTLSEALGIKRIKRTGSDFLIRQGDVLLNWGCNPSNMPHMRESNAEARWINNPVMVQCARNKLKTLDFFREAQVPTVPWTDDPETAKEWLQEGSRTVARTSLTGQSGSGIVVLAGPDDFIAAPLYTKYVKKKGEYRVHVIGDEAVAVHQKRKRRGFENVNYDVRTHENGWVYVRNDITYYADGDAAKARITAAAVAAVKSLSLDFGAVDVLYNERDHAAYVLEVNTAPGLEGETVGIYATGLQKLITGE